MQTYRDIAYLSHTDGRTLPRTPVDCTIIYAIRSATHMCSSMSTQRPGEHFAHKMQHTLNGCDVCVVVIEQNWYGPRPSGR